MIMNKLLLALALLLPLAGCGGQERIEPRLIRERLDPDEPADSYWFRATTTGDAILNIDSDTFDPVLEVYTDVGQLMVRDDDGGAGDDARATFRVNLGRLYQVVVTSDDPEPTGPYELTSSAGLVLDSVISRSR